MLDDPMKGLYLKNVVYFCQIEFPFASIIQGDSLKITSQ